MSIKRKFKRRIRIMEVTLREVVNSVPALNSLSKQKLQAKASFIIAKALKAISSEMDPYDFARLEACKKYGTLNEATDQYEFAGDNLVAFEDEMNVLLDAKVKIEASIPMSIIENASITPQEAMAMTWIVTE
jgi:hypothetical protein